MIISDMIRKVKQSTLAVGLVKRNEPTPYAIYGSGFIVDESGIIATAEHVLDVCKQVKKLLKINKNIDVDYAVFRVMHSTQNASIDTAIISDIKKITWGKKDPIFPLNDIDLGFGKMLSVIDDCHPLEIDRTKPSIFDEVALSGFPSGDYTLDIDKKYMGLRLSPNFQSGRITGFLPFDDAPDPYGIQLDIIGVGGSSGSPIFNLQTGKVIGIAQQVIPASVEVSTSLNSETRKTGYGLAKIGQVYGVSNTVLYSIVEGIKKFYRDGKLEDFVIHATALDFTVDSSSIVTVDSSKLE